MTMLQWSEWFLTASIALSVAVCIFSGWILFRVKKMRNKKDS